MPGTETAALARPASQRTRSIWAWAHLFGGASVVAIVLWRVGAGPFFDGMRAVHSSTLLAAFAVGVLTTVCSAWRWSLIAAGLGIRLPLAVAVAAYYRSQFLNTTLPSGMIGDVDRAVRHGRDIGDVGLGVRAAVLDRVAGQTVQGAIAVLVFLVFPSPVRSHMPLVLTGLGVAALAVVLVAQALARTGSVRWQLALRRAVCDTRDALFAGSNWVGIVGASCVIVLGHLATFVLAARATGSTASLAVLAPLTLLALLSMGLPLNVAGWGPREGVTAWAFGAAGISATQGVATSVTYGVLALVASLPGAGVLLVRWINRETYTNPTSEQSKVTAVRQGG